LVVLAGGLLLFPSSAAAGTITLLSPAARTASPPPLVGKRRSAGLGPQETRFPGRLRNVERIVVGIDRSGAPVRVAVTQRLTISRPGDFTFLVQAPATRVVAAPGSQAEPGLRDLGVVWQGFASGRRVLAATVTLAPAAAAFLPLRVSVERRAGSVALRLENIARGQFTVATGSVAPDAVRGFLARLSRTTNIAPSELALPGRAAGHATISVTAPLRVRGTITVPGRSPVAVSAVLGGGRPTNRTITVPGRALPALDLAVEPLASNEILPGPHGPALSLAGLQRVLGSVALARQYHHFLDSPDPSGPSTASYLYRTVERSPAAAVVRPSSGGDDTLAIVLIAVLGAVAVVGGAILWAHL
jgi:hypothetical protein